MVIGSFKTKLCCYIYINMLWPPQLWSMKYHHLHYMKEEQRNLCFQGLGTVETHPKSVIWYLQNISYGGLMYHTRMKPSCVLQSLWLICSNIKSFAVWTLFLGWNCTEINVKIRKRQPVWAVNALKRSANNDSASHFCLCSLWCASHLLSSPLLCVSPPA